MQQSKQIFSSGLDADSADYAIPKGMWVNMRNMRTGSTDRLLGNTTDLEAVPGADPFLIQLPAGTNYVLGSCYDEAGDRILRFVWNSNGDDGIYALLQDGTSFTVLLSADVTGGLGFSKDSCIHSCFALNGLLYWVDSTSQQPRRLNIDAAIKAYQPSFPTTTTAYSLPLIQSIISWIRRPPGLPPTASKLDDGTYDNNFVRFGSFMFTYRYWFRDYELSTLGSRSKLAPYNDNDDNTLNAIDVTIPLTERVEQDVQEVDLVAFYLDEGVARVIKSWNKTNAADAAAIAAHNAGTTALSYRFYADQTGTTLSSTYTDKLFDSVPIFAETAERGRNRTYMGNYTIGYDAPTETSLAAVAIPPSAGAVGLVIGWPTGSAQITGVTIGGTPVTFVGPALPPLNVDFPVGAFQSGTFTTPNTGPSETVVVSITGPAATVRVRYGPGDGTFTNIDQPFTGDGNYTFTGVPINGGTSPTWECTWEA